MKMTHYMRYKSKKKIKLETKEKKTSVLNEFD